MHGMQDVEEMMDEKKIIMLDNSAVSAVLQQLSELEARVLSLEQQVNEGISARLEMWQHIQDLYGIALRKENR